jgi:hypothetical protein
MAMNRRMLCRLRGPVVLASLVALAFLLRPSAQAGDSEERLPPPGKEELAKALDSVKSLYKKEFAEAKEDAEAGKALAATLLKEGKDTPGKEEAALRFAAISLARDVASQAGDHPTAMEAIEELARGFTVDTLPMKADALAAAAKSTKGKDESIALAETALQILEEAVHSDNYKAALSLVATAQTAAATAKNVALVGRVDKTEAEIRATQKEFERVQPFLTKLAKNADDKDANLEAGKYYCFFKNNWPKGLPYLAKCGDQSLKSLADRDLTKPKLAKKQVELGDAWAALGDKEKGPARKGLLRRAHHWYTEALSDPEALVGLTRVRVEKRAEEIAKAYPATQSALGTSNIAVEIRKMDGMHPGGEAVRFSPDGKFLLTGGNNDSLPRLWDVKTGKMLQQLNGHNGGAVYSVAISPDGKLGASGGSDNSIRIWDLKGGKLVSTIQQHWGAVRGLAFIAGGKQLVSASNDNTVRVWDVATGGQQRMMQGHTNQINNMAVSKDGSKALTTSFDNTARIWDLKTGVEKLKFMGHNRPVWGAALSPNGKVAATSGYDGFIRIWDANTGKELRTLEVNKSMVWSLAFSPDGKRLLAGNGGVCDGFGGVNFGNDNDLHLFDVSTGKEIRRIAGHTNWVRGVAFSNDGRYAASVGNDNMVRLWGSK